MEKIEHVAQKTKAVLKKIIGDWRTVGFVWIPFGLLVGIGIIGRMGFLHSQMLLLGPIMKPDSIWLYSYFLLAALSAGIQVLYLNKYEFMQAIFVIILGSVIVTHMIVEPGGNYGSWVPILVRSHIIAGYIIASLTTALIIRPNLKSKQGGEIRLRDVSVVILPLILTWLVIVAIFAPITIFSSSYQIVILGIVTGIYAGVSAYWSDISKSVITMVVLCVGMLVYISGGQLQTYVVIGSICVVFISVYTSIYVMKQRITKQKQGGIES